MADTDTQINAQPETQQAQNPLDNPLGLYRLKRLHPGTNTADARAFFGQLAGIADGSYVSVHSGLFQEATGDSLRYTKDTYFSGEHDAGTTLFRSELALIIYDWLYHQPELRENLSNILATKEVDRRVSEALEGILDHCQNIGEREWVTVNEAEEKEFDNLLSGERAVSTTASFIVDYIDNLAKDKEKEAASTETIEEEQKATATDEEIAETPLTAGVPAKPSKTDSTGGGGEIGGESVSQVPQPTDVLELKRRLFSAEVREQAARFTQIGLVQMEIFYSLPEGSLQNSSQLRELLSQKSLSFFANVLSQDRLELLLSSPEERFRFAREYIWLIQNDFRTKAAIAKYLSEVVLENADPALKAKIEEELIKAEAGEDVSELIDGLAKNPKIQQVVEDLKASSPGFQKSPDEYTDEITRQLQQYLKDIGVQTDKIPLAQANVANIVDAMTSMAFPIDVIDHFNEKRFKLIFGEDIPYDQGFLEFLKEYWLARRATQGKKYGNILLNAEARFAIEESLKLLDEDSPDGVGKEQSDQIFEETIAKPINGILVAHKDLNIPVEQTLELTHSRNLSGEQQEQQQALFDESWNNDFSPEQKADILRFAGYEETQTVVTTVTRAPLQLTTHALAPMSDGGRVAFYSPQQIADPRYASQFVPSNGLAQSAFSGVRNLQQRNAQLRGLPNWARKAGKSLRNRLSKKAAQDAAEKIASEGLSKAATVLPGGPATGWIAKQLATKKGRRRLALLGAGGGLSLIIPLSSWGGRIGGLLGTGAGWILSGGNPLAALFGGIGGSWLGHGIDKAVSGFFGGSGLGGGAATQAGGAGSGLFTGGGGGASLPPAQAAGVIAAESGGIATQAVASTGSQAVLATIGIVAAGTFFSNMVVSNALLADFPQLDPLGTSVPGTQGKISEYVTIEKRIFITGCPENKCENPAFPIRAEYSIIIRPKDNYSIAINAITDTLRVNHNADAWNEEGKSPPSIPEKIKTFNDFPELYEGITIGPGEELAFSYTENFDEKYNHATILNNFEINFFYNDPAAGIEGTDNAITGEVIYVGDFSQGAGCWPTSGRITQLPGGSFSHSGSDAFDIGNIEGTPIYAPFAGQACTAGLDSAIYGNYVVLQTPDGNRFSFGHMRSKPFSGCKSVEAGSFLGSMGTTGSSTGNHLHFGLIGGYHGSSVLATMMPGGTAVREDDHVRTCYDGG